MKKSNKTAKKGEKSTVKPVEEIIKKGEGKFNFPNGDSYEGEYIVINNQEIYRHGYGVYKTSDHDEYRGLWDKDCITSNFHILYSNKAEYKGGFDEEGAMSGEGTYVFPDGSSLKATWKDNEPHTDCVYKDPMGYDWRGKVSLNEERIVFTPENYIWKKYSE